MQDGFLNLIQRQDYNYFLIKTYKTVIIKVKIKATVDNLIMFNHKINLM